MYQGGNRRTLFSRPDASRLPEPMAPVADTPLPTTSAQIGLPPLLLAADAVSASDYQARPIMDIPPLPDAGGLPAEYALVTSRSDVANPTTTPPRRAYVDVASLDPAGATPLVAPRQDAASRAAGSRRERDGSSPVAGAMTVPGGATGGATPLVASAREGGTGTTGGSVVKANSHADESVTSVAKATPVLVQKNSAAAMISDGTAAPPIRRVSSVHRGNGFGGISPATLTTRGPPADAPANAVVPLMLTAEPPVLPLLRRLTRLAFAPAPAGHTSAARVLSHPWGALGNTLVRLVGGCTSSDDWAAPTAPPPLSAAAATATDVLAAIFFERSVGAAGAAAGGTNDRVDVNKLATRLASAFGAVSVTPEVDGGKASPDAAAVATHVSVVCPCGWVGVAPGAHLEAAANSPVEVAPGFRHFQVAFVTDCPHGPARARAEAGACGDAPDPIDSENYEVEAKAPPVSRAHPDAATVDVVVLTLIDAATANAETVRAFLQPHGTRNRTSGLEAADTAASEPLLIERVRSVIRAHVDDHTAVVNGSGTSEPASRDESGSTISGASPVFCVGSIRRVILVADADAAQRGPAAFVKRYGNVLPRHRLQRVAVVVHARRDVDTGLHAPHSGTNPIATRPGGRGLSAAALFQQNPSAPQGHRQSVLNTGATGAHDISPACGECGFSRVVGIPLSAFALEQRNA